MSEAERYHKACTEVADALRALERDFERKVRRIGVYREADVIDVWIEFEDGKIVP